MLDTNKIYLMDCVEGCKRLDTDSIDLVVTSPPYDSLRKYDNEQGLAWCEDTWKNLAQELYRVVKPGGVVVWIVSDATVEFNETLTSFKQALYFQSIGFCVYDTMIWAKGGGGAVGSRYSYTQNFEYMFVFSKGKPKSINLIRDLENNYDDNEKDKVIKTSRGIKKKPHIPKQVRLVQFNNLSRRNNWWYLVPHVQEGSDFHPAVFPPELARDHIISWSDKDDLVLDPFMGSGTTAIEAVKLGRKFIGFDISQEYIDGANRRLKKLTGPFRIFGNLGC